MLSGIFTSFAERLRDILYIAPVILLAIVAHECAHGWVSDKLGDPTPRNSGRLTLNPFKHLDPIGALCMLFFHVGWARPVPINPMYYRDRKKGIIFVSLAGPVTNFILAVLSLFLEGALLRFGAPDSRMILILCQLCYYSAVINVGLGLFNLIPLPPLDGSKVLGELWDKAAGFYWRYQRYWRWILLACVMTGILSKPLGYLNTIVIDGLWKIVAFLFGF